MSNNAKHCTICKDLTCSAGIQHASTLVDTGTSFETCFEKCGLHSNPSGISSKELSSPGDFSEYFEICLRNRGTVGRAQS